MKGDLTSDSDVRRGVVGEPTAAAELLTPATLRAAKGLRAGDDGVRFMRCVRGLV